ncbi:uncharacterized protein LOC115444742 [Manduca sexta]|uniref:Uncharacterized protein n=1 Tax=Manduca sexta TaxID=7130 RepID=A0A921Z743_MANSE|nr:uncharacterized protein LOC115444742 [Manduca sexta]KAG6452006.1 hypothetical protein O3G_MSEX007420 [Manduca sexta]
MSITENIRQEITKLVPASVINEISCFVFFESHPRDRNPIDIAVCTKSVEVKEFFQRDLVSSLRLDIQEVSDITLFRNDRADPFYLIFGGDQLLIISRGENLKIHKRINNVDRYEIEDTLCDGRASLKVFLNDDAVPLVFDDNFETVEEITNEDDVTAPIVTELLRKLTEAKYSVKCNEKMYEKLVNLRQMALFSKYQVNSTDGALSINGLKEIASALKIETLVPWVKMCNRKIVIIFEITNQDVQLIEDIQVLLHGTTRPVVTYTTKLFEKNDKPPFYKEKDVHNLQPNNKVAITVVVDLNELKCNVFSKVMFEAVVMFKKKEEFLLPLERINLSSFDTLKEGFDVLNKESVDDPNIILAILATTEKIDLHLRHIKRDGEKDIEIPEIFCTYLNMERVPNMNNVVIYRQSSYHILHGIMIVNLDTESHRNDYNISVYTRLPSQILSLIHFIHDAVPAKIVITTPNYKIKDINDEVIPFNKDISTIDSHLNYREYGRSILNRTSTLLEYLDRMMIKMNSSKNTTVQSKIGREIHLFADGVENYLDFRQKILREADKGVTEFLKCTVEDDSEAMIIE